MAGATPIIVGLAVTVLAIASCSKSGSSSSNGTPALGEPPPIDVVPAPTQAVIGPEGGTLVHASGARLVVPPGALPEPIALTLEGAAPPAEDVLGGRPLGETIQAGPEGQTFLFPVDLYVPFDPSRVPAGAMPELRMAPHASTDFVTLASDVDAAARTVHAATVHFTDFVPSATTWPSGAAALTITTTSPLPQAFLGTPYDVALEATGGVPPYTWAVAGGELPPALGLLPSGRFQGGATFTTVAAISIRATDAAGHAVQKAFALPTGPATSPVPVLDGLSPASAPEATATTIRLVGSGFVPATKAVWDGTALPTTFGSTTELSATIAKDLAVAGMHAVTAVTPPPGGGTSAAKPFSITSGGVVDAGSPCVGSLTPTVDPIGVPAESVVLPQGSFGCPVPTTTSKPVAYPIQFTNDVDFTMYVNHNGAWDTSWQIQLRAGCDMAATSLMAFPYDCRTHEMHLAPGVYTWIDCNPGGSSRMLAEPLAATGIDVNTSCATAKPLPYTETYRVYDGGKRYFQISNGNAATTLYVTSVAAPSRMAAGAYRLDVQATCDDASTTVYTMSTANACYYDGVGFNLPAMQVAPYWVVLSAIDPGLLVKVSINAP